MRGQQHRSDPHRSKRHFSAAPGRGVASDPPMMPWTMLKPTFFMQNTMMAARTIANDGVIYWDMKDGRG